MYCVPKEGMPLVPHEEILTYEEMLRLVRISVSMGVKKVRITGGEPLLRKGIVWFLKELSQVRGLEKITLTTNGYFLKDLARPLKEAGLKGINISLDSLKPSTFKHITSHDALGQVMAGIEACEMEGMSPIKLNAVIIRGVNDNELVDLAALTMERPWHVRFIEFMPVSNGVRWSEERVVGHKEILERLQLEFGELIPLPKESLGGPARCYQIQGAKGVVGLISPMTHNFCNTCNRIRITARGGLKTCLFSPKEVPLIGLLRSGRSDEEIRQVLLDAIQTKGQGRQGPKEKQSMDHMWQIGG
jgi:cyclic pyranopterin phosphate synthase